MLAEDQFHKWAQFLSRIALFLYLKVSEESNTEKIFEICKSRSIKWANEKMVQLKAAAAERA